MIHIDGDKIAIKGTKIQLMTEAIIFLKELMEKGIFSKFDLELITEATLMSDEEMAQQAEEQTTLNLMSFIVDAFGEDKAREIFNNINK